MDSDLVLNLNAIFEEAVARGASDIHLVTGMPAIFRIDGALVYSSSMLITEQALLTELTPLMGDNIKTNFTQEQAVDFACDWNACLRFRVNLFRQARGLSAVFRRISKDIPSLSSLELPAVLEKLIGYEQGLILLTGPTGSGKSTTLAAMVETINQQCPCHILTIEDPIEFLYSSKKALINQRELGRDTPSFHAALRAGLREDPDLIVVGELRDAETVRLAMTAAETGHLVLATLHTASAPKAVNRVVDLFSGAEKEVVRALLAESLQAVIAQRLIKKRSGGRIPLVEIMIATPAIRHLIRENKMAQLYSAIQTGQSQGMQTFEQHWQQLSQAQKI